MTAQVTHWLEHGEPNDDQTVEATHRVDYQTGPNESAREDDVTHGTLTYEGLERGWEENAEHVHEDGSLLLSALPSEERDAIMAEFTPKESGEKSIDWESEIEYDDADGEYDRSARGKLVIDGPDGRLIILKRYRAMIDEPKGLMETGKISEHSTYYRGNENKPFTDANASWDVPEDMLRDKDTFLQDCLAAVEADPQVEYEQYSDHL